MLTVIAPTVLKSRSFALLSLLSLLPLVLKWWTEK